MHHELACVFPAAQDDVDSDLIVLTGAGRAFCADGDTDWFRSQIEYPRRFRAIGPEARRIVTSLLDLEMSLLRRLNDAAAGLGATSALLGGLVIAADTVVIGDPHIKVGLMAGTAAPSFSRS